MKNCNRDDQNLDTGMEKNSEEIVDMPNIYIQQCCESGSGAFLPPGSGMNFFRIPDLFDYD
jgi:hypothetical protein